MHKCLKYSQLGIEEFEEEHSWGLALYIELLINNEEVTVCRHPSYIVIEDLKDFAEKVHNIGSQCEEIEIISGISRLLDSLLLDWRRDFEIIIRRKFVSISIYL